VLFRSLIDNYAMSSLEGPYVLSVILGVFLIIVAGCCYFQDHINRMFNGNAAVGQVEPRVMDPATLQQQILDDEELARQIQEELERDFNSLLLKQREERARKYRVFLKPYTMVVADADFSRENDGHGRNAQFQSVSFEFGSVKEEKIVSERYGEEVRQPATADDQSDYVESRQDTIELVNIVDSEPTMSYACEDDEKHHEAEYHVESNDVFEEVTVKYPSISATHTMDTNSSSDEGEYQVDLELGGPTDRCPLQERKLCLPVTDENGHSRTVNAECTICLMDYESGDKVVWSTRRMCPHAFHAECILVWLSKGKKRCPMCRNFFVPAQRVDGKDVIPHDESDVEAAMSLRDTLEGETFGNQTQVLFVPI